MDPHRIPNVPGKRSAEEAGNFFRSMADFVEFGQDDAKAIRESSLIIEKNLPVMIRDFYANLLKHPDTRQLFLKTDGAIDEDYLQLRMYHQANFWRRSAGGVYDDDYAGFVDYVGRAHTSRGADKNIFIPERYVIGMVGFMQHAISESITRELGDFNPELQTRAVRAWNKLCIVILQMLSRAYRDEKETSIARKPVPVDSRAILEMSVDSYEKGLGIQPRHEWKEIFVALEKELPEGERKIIEVEGLSIGVFHHQGKWVAIRNFCLHRGGPVATGKLVGDQIICPWHGFTYNLPDGRLLQDPSARLELYAVMIRGGEVWVRIPLFIDSRSEPPDNERNKLSGVLKEISKNKIKENEFFLKDIPPGRIRLLLHNRERVAVYNVNGDYYATSEECTHAGGPLSEGSLEGSEVTCPWHFSCFNVTTGEATCPPASEPLKTYAVILDGEIGRVVEKDSVQG